VLWNVTIVGLRVPSWTCICLVVPKYQEDPPGSANDPHYKRKLLPEMILVCNALRNDLIHPNEYVRGSMLRFLCKVNDEEVCI